MDDSFEGPDHVNWPKLREDVCLGFCPGFVWVDIDIGHRALMEKELEKTQGVGWDESQILQVSI